MTVPYSFANATVSIPLSQLDANFNTPITLGNTAIQLGNTVTTLNNMTLANVTISSGNVTITNVSVTTANVTTANITNMVSGNVAITGGSINGTTLGATTASTANVTTLTTSSTVTINGGTVNGVAYLNGSKVLTTGSALTFDGTNLTVANGDVTIATNGKKLYVNYIVNNSGTDLNINGATNQIFSIAGSEQMRLTSTGLGIGTSSPSARLDVIASSTNFISPQLIVGNSSSLTTGQQLWLGYNTSAGNGYIQSVHNGTAYTSLVINPSGGNLGLGVTPSAWSLGRVLQLQNGASLISYADSAYLNANAYFDGGWKYLGNAAASRYEMGAAHTWYTAASGTAGNAISFTQAMTLDASGNLGVGTTSPVGALQVLRASANPTVNVTRTTSSATTLGEALYLRLNDSNGQSGMRTEIGMGYGIPGTQTYTPAVIGYVQTIGTANTYGDLYFATRGVTTDTAPTERARITSGGDLLVGTTDNSGTAGNGFKLLNSGTNATIVTDQTTNAGLTTYHLYSTGAAAYRFYVGAGGTVYATNTTISAISDQRFKENIQDLDVGLDKIMALKPRKFDWKAGKGKDIKGDRGFIAQEFEQVFPDLIDEWKDPAPEGEEPYKSVRADLIPVLVKAIQELKSELDSVKAELATLKGK
jgi:hypothetical protein